MDPDAFDLIARVAGKTTSRRQLFKILASTGALAVASRLGLGTARETQAVAPATGPFQRTWSRTDQPVLEQQVSRTWMWGPEAISDAREEAYADAPGSKRLVQYFDKSRMEDNSYRASAPPWDVTNGLLVVELMSGAMQVGDAAFEQRFPAEINVAGDADDPTGPTYASLAPLRAASARQPGALITQRVDRDGMVTNDPSLDEQNVTATHWVEATNHTVAGPFWSFMGSSGLVSENGQLVEAPLFLDPFYATGLPITEAYWANVKVAGEYRDVLLQCFERRCLTYAPGNPPGWQVEAGNVGLHYYDWRYGSQATTEFCVPVTAEHKPKTLTTAKLRALSENNPVPSVMAGAFFQMARRYARGDNPDGSLEQKTFQIFNNMSPEAQAILRCSIDNFHAVPTGMRDRLIDPRFGLSDTAVLEDDLVDALASEILGRVGDVVGDDPSCMAIEHPGQPRPTDLGEFGMTIIPRICRVNELRTVEFSLTLAEYLPEELQQVCTFEPVDTDGDGTPDDLQQVCRNQTAPCPGNHLDGTCLRVLEFRPGDAVTLTGVNFIDIDARVRLELVDGSVVQEVPAVVCGDRNTPVAEIVDDVEQPIDDCRVTDRLTFTLPVNLPSGIYRVWVIVPNDLGIGTDPEFLSWQAEFIRVLAPADARFQITSEELYCAEETDGVGSDEVGIKVFGVVVSNDGTVTILPRQNFRFGDVDSEEERDMTRVLLDASNLAGIGLAILGHEIDSETAYARMIEEFEDAFALYIDSILVDTISAAIGAAGGAAIAIGFSLSGGWFTLIAAAIAAVIAVVIAIFLALWAPPDLIIEDMIGLSALDLDRLTSIGYPAPSPGSRRTPGGIVTSWQPDASDGHLPAKSPNQYHEERRYRSADEDSRYRIRLRYNRL